ncbi:hypothetical protein [Longimicrobium sp.]|uniref:hypothetical protein n=1 Tax=Longimicrobium sp. TaxID=2029185 RepID=UPI003B3ACEA2
MRLLIQANEDTVVDPATPDAIRAAFYQPELWYGASIELQSATGDVLGTSAATEMFMKPEDIGEFYLSFERGPAVIVLPQPLTREATLALFLRFAAGDTRFVDELPWEM